MVCATLSVAAGSELGIKTVSYSALVCGSAVMLFASALDGPWYILNVIGLHFIAFAFDTETFAQMALREWRSNDGQGANPSWMNWRPLFCWNWWIAWDWWMCWPSFVGNFMARILRGCTIKQVVMCALPFQYALLWFCIFGAGSIGMNRHAIWLDNIGTTGVDNVGYYLHAHTSPHIEAANSGLSVPAGTAINIGQRTAGSGSTTGSTSYLHKEDGNDKFRVCSSAEVPRYAAAYIYDPPYAIGSVVGARNTGCELWNIPQLPNVESDASDTDSDCMLQQDDGDSFVTIKG
ncbi:betT [Symbiodinium sp. CCMP2592]|nr:betT [Symbiodinium sp. CCMP2592]